MPRKEEYMTHHGGRHHHHNHPMENTNQRGGSRATSDHFSLLQGAGGRRYPSQFQNGFLSPRSVMRMSSPSNYDSLDDDVSASMLPGGYIAPGTHTVPTSSTTFYSRRPTPRPSSNAHMMMPSNYGNNRASNSGFRPRLGHSNSNNNYANYDNHHNSHHHHSSLGPIFPDEEDDTFFPPDTLPTIDEVLLEYGSGDYAASNSASSRGFPEIGDVRSREVFEERLASFPEVPLDAHRRIFLMGNDIVDCFEVRLDRFYRGSLLDSMPNCVAVFTKKERTGQRWLMVFKEDISRTVVKFNRLLTHSLLVSVVSPTAIEIEAAKSLYGPPSEMCVINFVNTEDSSRFYKTLQEGQTTAWNHREVTHEQRMKNIFTKISVALAQADLISSSSVGIASGSRAALSAEIPSRSPFTFSVRNRGGGGDPMAHASCSSSNSSCKASPSGLSLPLRSRHPSEPRTPLHVADLDDNWRNPGRGGEDDGGNNKEFGVGLRPRSRQQADRLRYKESLNRGSGLMAGTNSIIINNTNNNPIMMMRSDNSGGGGGDSGGNQNNSPKPPTHGGGGDGDNTKLVDTPGDVIFQVFTTVFVKLDLVYAEFGTGTLQILDHGDVALNELRLVDGDKRELLHQYIYKWNSSLKRLDESTKTCLCLWDGAVCFSLEADAVPERRDFKVRLSSEGEADDFVDTFNKSVEKAHDESIRKRHIVWYLQNKRDYKNTTSNASASSSSSSQQF